MESRIISEIQSEVKPFLNQTQDTELAKVLLKCFNNVEIKEL